MAAQFLVLAVGLTTATPFDPLAPLSLTSSSVRCLCLSVVMVWLGEGRAPLTKKGAETKREIRSFCVFASKEVNPTSFFFCGTTAVPSAPRVRATAALTTPD